MPQDTFIIQSLDSDVMWLLGGEMTLQSSHGNTMIESMSRSQIVSMVSLCAFPAIVVLVLVTVSIQMDFPSVDFLTECVII